MAVIIFGQFGSPNQRQSKAANCNGVTSKSMPSQSRVYVLIETVQTGLNGVSVVRDWMGHHNGILTVNSPAPPPHFQPSPCFVTRQTVVECATSCPPWSSLRRYWISTCRATVDAWLEVSLLRYFSLHWTTSISRKKYSAALSSSFIFYEYPFHIIFHSPAFIRLLISITKLSLTISNCDISLRIYFQQVGWKIVWKENIRFSCKGKNCQMKWLNSHFLAQSNNCIAPFELLNRHFPHFDKYQIPLPFPPYFQVGIISPRMQTRIEIVLVTWLNTL